MTKSRHIADLSSDEVLTTSDTGVDVTGTVTADGLTVDGVASIDNSPAGGAKATQLELGKTSSGTVAWEVKTQDDSGDRIEFKSTRFGADFEITRNSSIGEVMVADFAAGENNATSLNLYGDEDDNTVKIKLDADGDTYFTGGKVGIGTSSPSTRLDIISNVEGTADTITLTNYAGESSRIRGERGLTLSADYNDNSNSDQSKLSFETDGTQKMVIMAGGYVGIGEDAPQAKLHIRGTNNLGGILVEDSSGASASPAITVTGKRSDGNNSQAFGGKLLLSKNKTDGAMNANNLLGTVMFGGNHTDGSLSSILYAASISGVTEGTFTNSTTMPTGLAFYTGSTGQSGNTSNVTTGSEVMRIDSSGNVGIGTSSPSTALDISKDAPIIRLSDTKSISWTGGESLGGVEWYTGDTSGIGAHQVGFVTLENAGSNTTPRGELVFGTSIANTAATERMRIDSSGNVGIGTITPKSSLTIMNTNAFNGGTGYIVFGDRVAATQLNSPFITQGSSDGAAQDLILGTHSGSGSITFYTGASSGSVPFTATNTEAMRIDADGNVLFGCTSQPSPSIVGSGFTPTGNDVELKMSTDTTAANALVRFYNPNGQVGNITISGTSTAYNTSSDYRLKEDWQPMVSNFDRVSALKPVNFAWKVDGSRVDGFLAHELADVVPEAVTGEKDAVDAEGNPEYQAIDQSKLVPLLTAALQEAITEIETLKADVALLKGTN